MSLVASTRSELTKQFTTAGWWVLALVLLLYVGSTAAGLGWLLSATATGSLPVQDGQGAPALSGDMIAAPLYSLAASIGFVFPLLVGTLMATVEFRHQTLTPTFLATPKRGLALTGKAVAGIVMGALFAAVALVASVVPSAGLLALFGLDTAFSSGETWAIIGRTALALILWTLIGIGIGTLVRNQVAAIVIVLAFTQFVEPIARLAASFVEGLSTVGNVLPGAASDALVGFSLYGLMGSAPGSGSPLEWWAGGLILAAYAAVLLVLGYLVSWRRDVS